MSTTIRPPAEVARLLRTGIAELKELTFDAVDAMPWLKGGGEIRGVQSGLDELVDELLAGLAPQPASAP